jgi:hypothetical protein
MLYIKILEQIEPRAGDSRPITSAFVLVTGPQFGTSRNELQIQFPEGKFVLWGDQSTFWYWYTLQSTPPLTDMRVSLFLQDERVRGALATWRGAWPDTKSCSKSRYINQLVGFLINIWGIDDPFPLDDRNIAYSFRNEGISIQVDVGEDDEPHQDVVWFNVVNRPINRPVICTVRFAISPPPVSTVTPSRDKPSPYDFSIEYDTNGIPIPPWTLQMYRQQHK